MSKQPKISLRDIIAENSPPPAPVVEQSPPPVPAPVAVPATAEVVAITAAPKRQARNQPVRRPAPQGTLRERAHQLSLYLEEPVYEQLRELAFTERKKAHPLILEGLDLLFKKRGLPSIEDLLKRAAQ